MQITGTLHGAKLLRLVGFPTPALLGPDASEEQIKALLDQHGETLREAGVRGGVGKKGKAGTLLRHR